MPAVAEHPHVHDVTQQRRRDEHVPATGQDRGRHPRPPVVRAAEARQVVHDELPVQLLPGARVRGTPAAFGELADGVLGRAPPPQQEPRQPRPVAQHSWPEQREFPQRRVPEAPRGPAQRPPRRPGVGHGEREVRAHPFRGAQAERERRPRAPAVGNDRDFAEAERIEQGQEVLYAGRRVVAVRWRVGPPGAAEVRAQHAVAGGEARDHPAPRVPVLREAVQQEHGRAGTGLGDVQPHRAGPDEAVRHAVDGGERVFVHARGRAFGSAGFPAEK
ncbi:hypothetical protein PV458_12895 [Streptomyces sp. MN03-5084-2B]|nr:hypothetical protein [Streptomyces sp. MN03-5084-2B]